MTSTMSSGTMTASTATTPAAAVANEIKEVSDVSNTAKTMDVIRDCSPTRPKLVKTSERHARAILDNFAVLRRQGDLCDVVLNVGSSRIRAHKIILSASSPYFKAMFTNELAESKQAEITIKDIDENAMEILIDFCYSAKITIDEKIVQSLLPAACLLQLQEVQDYCAEFLKSQLDPSNCLGIRAFADTHSCRELLKIADKYLQMNFIDVVEADEFMQLPVNQLVEIVSNDELNVRCEEQVYEACMNWIKYDLDERRVHLAQLMSQVRLPLLDIKYLVTKVGTDPLIRQDQACRDLVDEAKDYHLLPHEKVNTTLLPARYRPRKPIITGEVLFAVGGWCSGDAIASVEMFDPQSQAQTNEWKIVASMSKRRCGVGVGVLNNQIYAIGGHDGSTYLNNTERYDPTLNQWFSDVAPTASCRTSVGVAVMDGYLYAVGGQDGVSCLNIVDKYDPNTNRWTRMTSMNSKRLGVAVVVLGNYLYAVGGSDGTSPLNTVERYDAKNNRWNFVAPMLSRRKHLGCAVFKNYIYAVGGRDDCIELNSAERYDPHTNQWQPVVAMKSRRSGVGLAVVNGVLMAIGGFDGTTYLKTCEVYDPDMNMWKLSGSMIYRRLGGGVGVIKMTKENNSSTSSATTSNENRLQSPSSISICKTPVSTAQSSLHRPLPTHQQVYNSSSSSSAAAAAATNNQSSTSSNNTTTTTTNNSWPFILSPMPSILANVQSSTGGNIPHHHHHNNHHHHHHGTSSVNRPIASLSPTSTITSSSITSSPNNGNNSNNAISIATITTSESLINDLSHFNIDAAAAANSSSSSTSPSSLTNHNSRATQPTRSSLSGSVDQQQPTVSNYSSSSSSSSSSPNTANSANNNNNNQSNPSSSSSIKLVDV